jgi:predicted pyridoxine 5'-phosphate oxidase superfamily flavin-nucleotide-binding protein
MKSLDEIFHDGELEMQSRFNKPILDVESHTQRVNKMYMEKLNRRAVDFLAQQKYFFIATASMNGECDCSFRGTESDENNELIQSLHVVNESQLVFPDYSGNNMYNSLGNMVTNPNIGMLFIDFKQATRLRVNGKTTVLEDNQNYEAIWPTALRFIMVDIESVFWNCPQRIRESVNF